MRGAPHSVMLSERPFCGFERRACQPVRPLYALRFCVRIRRGRSFLRFGRTAANLCTAKTPVAFLWKCPWFNGPSRVGQVRDRSRLGHSQRPAWKGSCPQCREPAGPRARCSVVMFRHIATRRLRTTFDTSVCLTMEKQSSRCSRHFQMKFLHPYPGHHHMIVP